MHSLKPTAKGKGQSSSRSQTWTTDYFDTRRRATRQGYQGYPDFSDVTLVLNNDDRGISSHLAKTYGYFFQHRGKQTLSESYDFRGQEIQVDCEEARIVDYEGGGGKFKCDESEKICERSNS